MSHVLVPGARDVRGTRDEATDADPAVVDADAQSDRPLVVACPPHPQHGGSRSDGRLRAVSDALTDRGIDCLRFDYGPWDEGRGECEDVRNAIRWATDETDRVGVFGYSFGAGEAILAAASTPADLAAVSVLAPPARLGPDLDVVDAVEGLDGTPVQACYGVRDDTVDWDPVVERVRELTRGTTAELAGDHFFVGQETQIGTVVADFFAAELVE